MTVHVNRYSPNYNNNKYNEGDKDVTAMKRQCRCAVMARDRFSERSLKAVCDDFVVNPAERFRRGKREAGELRQSTNKLKPNFATVSTKVRIQVTSSNP
uniref:Transposase n=1 Tax=Angiostrongylus cantonensis TaxID=6313 RepID=A0A0K0D5Y7_ANGCA